MELVRALFLLAPEKETGIPRHACDLVRRHILLIQQFLPRFEGKSNLCRQPAPVDRAERGSKQRPYVRIFYVRPPNPAKSQPL
jgi:hypothetical protein